jgi:hypothetical protein
MWTGTISPLSINLTHLEKRTHSYLICLLVSNTNEILTAGSHVAMVHLKDYQSMKHSDMVL